MGPVSDHGGSHGSENRPPARPDGARSRNQTCAAGRERREERNEGKTNFGRHDLREFAGSRRARQSRASARIQLPAGAEPMDPGGMPLQEFQPPTAGMTTYRCSTSARAALAG